jgi:Fe-S cluster assembly protein SufD
MMSQATKESSSYRAAFQASLEREGAGQPSWVRLLREGALERFEAAGFPSTDAEDWKYTNVASVARSEFRPAPRAPEISAEAVESFVHEESRRSRLVFVNGYFRPEFSASEALPAGIVAADLSEALDGEHSEVIRQHLARTTGHDEDAFTALNTAFLDGGAFIFVPKDVAVAAPVQILFLSTGAGDTRHAAFPRVLAVFERGAQATVIESYAATGDAAYFTDAAVEVFVGEGAHVHHYKVQRESERAFHVASTRAELARASAYDLTTVTLGARLSRHGIAVKPAHHRDVQCAHAQRRTQPRR